jgi:glycosyltransferase involved in cell wall biosynthesis
VNRDPLFLDERQIDPNDVAFAVGRLDRRVILAAFKRMPAPKRILHVIDSFDLGGAQEALVNLVAHRDRSRFEPEVATMHGRGIYWDRFRALGVPVHSLSPHKLAPLYVWNLARLLLTGNFDIVHCHLIASNFIAKPLAALVGVPVRFNHDQANDEYRHRHRLRLLLDALTNRLSTHICAVSQSIVEFLERRERVPRAKISLVHNAIDLCRFTPSPVRRAAVRQQWGMPLDAPIIGGVGRLNYQKNFALFIEIAAEVRRTHPHAHFVIAGTGPDEAMLRERASGLVRLLGYVADTAPLFDAIDFLLMPSRFEGLPMAMLEAMAMRVPVIASRLDGIAEAIDDGIDGLLASPGAREEFGAHIRALLDDPHRAAQLAARASEKVRARFSAERMTREVEALYDRYLG